MSRSNTTEPSPWKKDKLLIIIILPGELVKRRICTLYTSRVLSQRAMMGKDAASSINRVNYRRHDTVYMYCRQPPTTPPSSHWHYYSRQIARTNLLIPKGWIAWLATAYVYIRNLLRVITRSNPKARAELNPDQRAQDLTRCIYSVSTNHAANYRLITTSQITALSAVEVEPTTFRTVVTNDDKD